LPLLPTTREFLALVEREPGYPVRVLEDPNLPTLLDGPVEKTLDTRTLHA
jgi:hypothetical protein